MRKARPGMSGRAFAYVESGGVLLSHTLPGAVPSALEGLASGFGMRPGVSPALCPPKHLPTHAQPATLIPGGLPGWGGGCSYAVNHTVDADQGLLVVKPSAY